MKLRLKSKPEFLPRSASEGTQMAKMRCFRYTTPFYSLTIKRNEVRSANFLTSIFNRLRFSRARKRFSEYRSVTAGFLLFPSSSFLGIEGQRRERKVLEIHLIPNTIPRLGCFSRRHTLKVIGTVCVFNLAIPPPLLTTHSQRVESRWSGVVVGKVKNTNK